MSTQPAPAPKYDLPPELGRKIADHRARVPAAVKAAEAIKITDDRTEQLAVNARHILKEKHGEAEKDRTTEVAVHNAYVKHVNGLFKPLTDAIDKAVTYVDGQLLAWRREKQLRVDAENRRVAAETEQKRQEEEARVAAEAKAAGYTPQDAREIAQLEAADAVPAPVLQPEAPKVTRTDFAAAGVTSRLDFEVVNLAELVTSFPDVVDVRRAKVLDLGRGLEEIGQVAPFEAYGVRFFRKDSIQQR